MHQKRGADHRHEVALLEAEVALVVAGIEAEAHGVGAQIPAQHTADDVVRGRARVVGGEVVPAGKTVIVAGNQAVLDQDVLTTAGVDAIGVLGGAGGGGQDLDVAHGEIVAVPAVEVEVAAIADRDAIHEYPARVRDKERRLRDPRALVIGAVVVHQAVLVLVPAVDVMLIGLLVDAAPPDHGHVLAILQPQAVPVLVLAAGAGSDPQQATGREVEPEVAAVAHVQLGHRVRARRHVERPSRTGNRREGTLEVRGLVAGPTRVGQEGRRIDDRCRAGRWRRRFRRVDGHHQRRQLVDADDDVPRRAGPDREGQRRSHRLPLESPAQGVDAEAPDLLAGLHPDDHLARRGQVRIVQMHAGRVVDVAVGGKRAVLVREALAFRGSQRRRLNHRHRLAVGGKAEHPAGQVSGDAVGGNPHVGLLKACVRRPRMPGASSRGARPNRLHRVVRGRPRCNRPARRLAWRRKE